MKFNHGKDLTVMSMVWVSLAIGIAVTGYGVEPLLLCLIMSELSMIDTGVHAMGKELGSLIELSKEDKSDGDS